MVVFDDLLGVLVVLFCLCACFREHEPSRIRWVRLFTLDDVVIMCVDCYQMRLFSLRVSLLCACCRRRLVWLL
ncbi:hypothetical protein I4F81_011543 [Pyropia yezoensis]|uniref:Uncharacterized protein n=1 Tax=Pyropia yezoensis TaxID=2788 RepID=A0ACC3CH07_PYRYE|nr:hypothetical protein I4F81_011543 [Neopyropia yezoensis]